MITATIMAHKIKIVQNGNGRCYTSGRWSEASEIMEYSPRSLKYAIYNFSGKILHKTYRPSGQSSNATLPLDGLMGKRNRSRKVTFGQNFSTKDFLKRKFEKKENLLESGAVKMRTLKNYGIINTNLKNLILCLTKGW